MMCIYQVVHLLCTFLPEKAFFHVLFPKEKVPESLIFPALFEVSKRQDLNLRPLRPEYRKIL